MLTDPSIVAWCVNGLLVLSLLCCGNVFTYGLNHLKKKPITLELLTVLSGLVALADGIMAAPQGRVPYGATACVLLWLAQWNRFLQWEGMYRTLKVLEKNDVQIGIVRSENVYRGKAALFTAEITPEAFMEQMQKPALSDLVLQIYAPLAFLLTLALAILTHVREQAFFLQCWTPMLLAAIPVAGLLCYGRTFAILARRLARRGSALCGWAGACAMGNDTAVLLRDLDLFPAGSVEPNGVKSYNGYTGTQVVGYAAAVLEKAGSGLAPVLDTLLEREGGRHMQAEAIRLYENGGIGGKFGRDAILVGTLSFMRRMGVHMNTETRVKRATYVSVNGELAGLIAVRYSAAPSVREALQILTRSGRVKPVMATCNVTITPKMLHQKFHIAQDRVEYPDLRTRAELAGKTADPDSSLCAMLVQDQLSSFSDTAVGGRILQTVVRVGLVMAILSGIAAVAVLGVLSLTGAIVGLSASYLLLFDLIWLVPVLLLTGWTRNY